MYSLHNFSQVKNLMDARLGAASEDKKSPSDIAIDTAIERLFYLIPEKYRRGKTPGQTIEFHPPKNPFEEKEYSHNTVRSLYIILLLTKRSQIFNCDNWSSLNPFKKFQYIRTHLGMRLGRILLKHLHALDAYNHDDTVYHSWVPQVVDPLTFEAGKVLSCLLLNLVKLRPQVNERDQLVYKRKLLEERLKDFSVDYRIDYIKRKSTQLENKIERLLATGPEIERAEKNKLLNRADDICKEHIALININNCDREVFVPISQRVTELVIRVNGLTIIKKNPEYDPLTLDQLMEKLIALQARQVAVKKLIHESALVTGLKKITTYGISFLKKIKMVDKTESFSWENNKENYKKISDKIILLEKYIADQKAEHEKFQNLIKNNCITPLKNKIADIEKSNHPHKARRIAAIQETISFIQEEIATKLPEMTGQNFKEKSIGLKKNIIGKMIQLSQSPVFDMGIKEGLKRIALQAAAFLRCAWAKEKLEKRVIHCKSSLFAIHTDAQKNILPEVKSQQLRR